MRGTKKGPLTRHQSEWKPRTVMGLKGDALIRSPGQFQPESGPSAMGSWLSHLPLRGSRLGRGRSAVQNTWRRRAYTRVEIVDGRWLSFTLSRQHEYIQGNSTVGFGIPFSSTRMKNFWHPAILGIYFRSVGRTTTIYVLKKRFIFTVP